MKIQTLVIITLTYITLSCSEGFLVDMMRVIADPVIEDPSVVSFETEGTIYISWVEDPGADEYILYKAEDALTPVYEIIYQGTQLSLTDTDVTGEHRYLYTLSKVRGTSIFGSSDPVLGVGSLVIKDELEDNNTKGTATKLVWDLDANLYYYRSNDGVEIEDLDWYSITVPPRRKAIIVVTQSGLASGANSWMEYYLESNVHRTVVNNDFIPIENTSYDEKTFYFQISPDSSDPTEFIGNPAIGGGGLINYKISLNSIQSL